METREAFVVAQCPGVVALIDYLKQEGVVEISSASIVDPKGILDEVTTLMMQRVGIRGSMSYWDPVFGERQKAMRFGNATTIDGRRMNLTAVEWLGLMSAILPELSPRAREKFDSVCASMVEGCAGPSEPWTEDL